MRPFDRDLIRGGHYGQRSCEPHSKAEHMAAPTNAAFVKKVLANSEPSTHGPIADRDPAPDVPRDFHSAFAGATLYPGKLARSIACCTNPEAFACSINALM